MLRFQRRNVSSLKLTLASTNQLEPSLPPLLRGSEAAESTCTRTQESTTLVIVIPCQTMPIDAAATPCRAGYVAQRAHENAAELQIRDRYSAAPKSQE